MQIDLPILPIRFYHAWLSPFLREKQLMHRHTGCKNFNSYAPA